MSGDGGGGEDDIDGIEVSPTKLLVQFAKPILLYGWYWLRGYKLVLVGPSEAGKTRFMRFLYTLQLLPDHRNDIDRAADRTLYVEKEGLVVLRIGGQQVLLPLRAVIDTPGQEGSSHADLIIDSKQPTSGAHVVVIVVDGSNREQAVEWIGEFSQRLIRILAQAHQLCEVFVLVNKLDKCEREYNQLNKDIAEALRTALAPAIGERAKQIKILPTILVEHPEAAKHLNVVFQQLAFSLRRDKNVRTFHQSGGGSK